MQCVPCPLSHSKLHLEERKKTCMRATELGEVAREKLPWPMTRRCSLLFYFYMIDDHAGKLHGLIFTLRFNLLAHDSHDNDAPTAYCSSFSFVATPASASFTLKSRSILEQWLDISRVYEQVEAGIPGRISCHLVLASPISWMFWRGMATKLWGPGYRRQHSFFSFFSSVKGTTTMFNCSSGFWCVQYICLIKVYRSVMKVACGGYKKGEV